MQEEVENRTLTLVVSGTKFTGRMFKAAISGYGYSISDGKAGMAHRTQQTGNLRRIENQGCGEKYPSSCLLG